MGLDVTFGCWSGPYSMFNRWRAAMAEKAGIPLGLMEGYYPPSFLDGARYWEVTTVDAVSRPNYDAPASDYRSEGIDEFMAKRPDFAAWREEAKADGFVERRYVHPYIDRFGVTHNNEHVEVPRGPAVVVPSHLVAALAWLRARGPDGPLCQSSHGPSVERFIVEIARWLPLSWDLFSKDPLTILLDHSDCGGSIGIRHELRLAARLDEMALLFGPSEGAHPSGPQTGSIHDLGPLPERGCYDGYRNACLRFAAGLRAAHAEHRSVKFG